MRELIGPDELKLRRATGMQPAAFGCTEMPTLGEQAARLARVATAIHLDQAAKLRALMAQVTQRSVPDRAFSTPTKDSP